MIDVMDPYNENDMYHQYGKHRHYDTKSILLNHTPRKVSRYKTFLIVNKTIEKQTYSMTLP